MKAFKNISVLLLNLVLFTCAMSAEGQYECGKHGRFEYCIDGIPGCVIGCHCHPGYYFDTETKICEPNIKLAEDTRRHYAAEPTRVSIPSFNIISEPTPTTTNVIDENVEAIAKDADDLSDWLYNQFFKTIENQVINKTDGEQLLTRRSQSKTGPSKRPQSRRKSRKSSRHSKRKKHSSNNLRKKLLRITEDDSLFDSDSSSSYSSSASSSASSETSNESNDKEHGHRKIIMINKKSTPLPSFIFLPNIDTPFYPPIGLPPPPIVPMYPMAPIPPMVVYPASTCEPKSTTEPPKETKSTIPDSTTESTTASPSPTTDEPTTTTDNEPEEDPTETKPPGRMATQRREFLRKLRDRMSKKNKKIPRKHFVERQNKEPDLTYLNDGPLVFPDMMRLRAEADNSEPKLDDVNFKYLTQLIHKKSGNKGQSDHGGIGLLGPSNPLRDLIEPPSEMTSNRNILHQTPTRRFEYQSNFPKSNDPDSNLYYTNLGREIALLIRKANSQKDQNGFEIEENPTTPSDTIANQQMFNENLFAPRSYWERSVRSPLTAFSNHNSNFQYIPGSSEKLVSLEEQANFAATTKATLTLQQIENIVRLMDKPYYQVGRKQNSKRTNILDDSLNINLLPPMKPPMRVKNDRRKYTHLPPNTRISLDEAEKRGSNKIDPKYITNFRDIFNKSFDYEQPQNKYNMQFSNVPIRRNLGNANNKKQIQMTVPRKPLKDIHAHQQNKSQQNLWTKKSLRPYITQVLNKNFANGNTGPLQAPVSYKHQRKPGAYQQNWHYKDDDLENTYLPFFSNQIQKPSSYFYHVSRHFDYFE